MRAGHAFRLASAYWTSKDWKFAWGATAVLVVLQFTGAYVFVASNRWQQAFFDSVEKKELARFVPLVLAFGGIMLWQVGQSLFSTYVGMNLAMRWRTFLTERYLGRWMSHNRFAEIERLRLIDNPDQRIAEDIGKITGPTLANYSSGIFFIALGFIGQTFGAITFIGILMETAEPIRLTIAGRALSIPGGTVWYAFLYALLGSYLMVLIGKPYIRARMRQQHCEADFRAGLINVRRNAAQIGFVGAVPLEQASLAQSFSQIRRNYRSIMLTLMGIQTGQGIYQRIGGMVPLFLMVPRYFAGAFSFGQMMGARDAFETLVGQLSYFVQSYSSIGEQIANLNRIKALDDALDHHRPRGIGFSIGTAAGTAMTATGLHLMRPHGAPLLDIADWRITEGERWVVQGPSGAGKSTLLRAMAGLWPDGRGAVTMTGEGTVMFVPQRLYLPMGTLKAAICFPDAVEAHDDAAILALLERVRLSDHAERLHEARIWQEELSPGEQQRVALARILLHRPTLLVLDEATSALDRDNARHFHEQLLGDLPGVTLVSVVHDDRLRPFHTHCLTIADGCATPARIPENQA